MRQSEHGVKIGRGYKLSVSGLDPPRLGDSLTFGTMPIATRVVSLSLKATLSAAFRMPAEAVSATRDEIIDDALFIGGYGVSLGIAWAEVAQDVSDFETALALSRHLDHVSLAGCWPHCHRGAFACERMRQDRRPRWTLVWSHCIAVWNQTNAESAGSVGINSDDQVVGRMMV